MVSTNSCRWLRGDDVRVVADTDRRFEDGTVLRVRVLAVPKSEKFPDGIKYRLHYGADDGETLIRYDNSHGVHERHTADGRDEAYEFPGYDAVQGGVLDRGRPLPRGTTPMTQDTLIVTVESIAALRQRTADAFEAARGGDAPDTDAPHRLSFETTDQLASVFTPRGIDLLRAIARDEPASIREAARLVDRDIKQVSENLERLEAYGVVEFVEDGRAKRPVVPYDEIDIRLPLRDDGERDTAPA